MAAVLGLIHNVLLFLYPFQRCADNGKGKVVMETQRNPTNISIDNSHVFTLPDGDVDTCVVVVVILMK